MMTGPCLAGVSYAFPAASMTVGELARSGLLKSDASVLEGFGFGQVHVAECESPFDLGLEAARSLLEERSIDPDRVGLLIYTGTPGTASFLAGSAPEPAHSFLRTTERFRFPATRLQYELGLGNASVLALDQLACTGLFGAIRVARGLCVAESIDLALCVSAEFFPADAGREAIFNCTSDAACAVLVARGGDRNRIVASTHLTKGYYWDGDALHDEIVASYFPTAAHVIRATLESAGWDVADVDWVIPHNVSLRSWDVLLRLTGLSHARLWSRNIPRDGHTLAGDNFINLCDALASGSVHPGDRLLLFSYGYGAHWTAIALEA
jgi:3-oxoacyl-[acyl-carrier-protein] synthase-3